MGGRMRIHPHTAVALEPNRSTPVTRQPNSVRSTPIATKPTMATQSAASSIPFTSLFQTLSAGNVATSTPKAVSPASLFGSATNGTPAATNTVGTNTAAGTPATAATTAATAPAGTSVTIQTPGVQALVTAIMDGSFKPTYVTDQSKLQETTPVGTDTMPNFYYASDATANQLASLLGGNVVQRTAFGQNRGWNEPLANFIQLPNGQTFNAADVAYYANCGSVGASQLTADLTQTINEGSAWTNYYTNGGQIPTFQTGYVGPPISGMAYPTNMIGADGNVINPAMQNLRT